MKKVVFILLLASCLFFGCDRELFQIKIEIQNIELHQIIFDGCEYLYARSGSGLTHKGNCSNPIHGARE